MRVRRAAKAVAIVVSVLAAITAATYRMVDVAVTESYSHEWTADSSAQAAAEGRLIARPAVLTPAVELNGRALRVADAWVERAYHVDYVAFAVPRRVLDDRYRLIVRLAPADGHTGRATVAMASGGQWLAYNGTRFGSTTGDHWSIEVHPPFPPALRLSAR